MYERLLSSNSEMADIFLIIHNCVADLEEDIKMIEMLVIVTIKVE